MPAGRSIGQVASSFPSNSVAASSWEEASLWAHAGKTFVAASVKPASQASDPAILGPLDPEGKVFEPYRLPLQVYRGNSSALSWMNS